MVVGLYNPPLPPDREYGLGIDNLGVGRPLAELDDMPRSLCKVGLRESAIGLRALELGGLWESAIGDAREAGFPDGPVLPFLSRSLSRPSVSRSLLSRSRMVWEREEEEC